VHEDVLLRVLGLEEQQLGGDEASHMILDRAGDEDDPFTQQPRKDVEAALAPVGLFDDDWNELRNDVLVVNHVNAIPLWLREPTSGGTLQGSSGPDKRKGGPVSRTAPPRDER